MEALGVLVVVRDVGDVEAVKVSEDKVVNGCTRKSASGGRKEHRRRRRRRQ